MISILEKFDIIARYSKNTKFILDFKLVHCQADFDGFVGVQSEALRGQQSFALNSNRLGEQSFALNSNRLGEQSFALNSNRQNRIDRVLAIDVQKKISGFKPEF
jgi:hypothetical protein